MKYSAIHNQLIIDQNDLKLASGSLMYALKKARLMAGKPLTKYERDGPLEEVDYLGSAILDAAKNLGIDFGAKWANEIDVSTVV